MSTMKGSNTDGGGKRGRVMSDDSVKPTDISISRQNTTGNVQKPNRSKSSVGTRAFSKRDISKGELQLGADTESGDQTTGYDYMSKRTSREQNSIAAQMMWPSSRDKNRTISPTGHRPTTQMSSQRVSKQQMGHLKDINEIQAAYKQMQIEKKGSVDVNQFMRAQSGTGQRRKPDWSYL